MQKKQFSFLGSRKVGLTYKKLDSWLVDLLLEMSFALG